jgi:hypothetical protein
MARGDRDLAKEQFWRGVLLEWKQSRKSVRAFCAERGLNESKFFCWRRTIAKRDGAYAPLPRSKTGASRTPLFVPIEIKPPAAAPALEIVVSGRVIRVPTDFDAVLLRRLLAVLDAGASPC